MSTPQDNRICILGMGYVGLTLAVVMAENGFEVHGIEINPRILSSIRKGKSHFYEANLNSMLSRNLRKGRLSFAGEIPRDTEFDAYMITVGTPLDTHGKPRMDMVRSVSREVAEHMRDGAIVILRSTVRLGTTFKVTRPLLDGTGKAFDLAFCPERTIEGNALAELPLLPQIVGGLDRTACDRAGAIFQRITPTILKVSSIQTAELIKLLDNSYRDMLFAFGNEVALLCEQMNLDAAEVIKSANLGYERTNIAWPGFVGGPCLEKDPHILIDSLTDFGHIPTLVSAARRLNEELVHHAFTQAVRNLGHRDRLVVGLLGMAFKGQPDTDDMRGSPSLLMLDHIRRELPGVTVKAQDYLVQAEALEQHGLVACDDTEVFRDCHIVFLLNNNRRYFTLDFESRATLMARPGLIYDAWNIIYRQIDLPPDVKLHALGR